MDFGKRISISSESLDLENLSQAPQFFNHCMSSSSASSSSSLLSSECMNALTVSFCSDRFVWCVSFCSYLQYQRRSHLTAASTSLMCTMKVDRMSLCVCVVWWTCICLTPVSIRRMRSMSFSLSLHAFVRVYCQSNIDDACVCIWFCILVQMRMSSAWAETPLNAMRTVVCEYTYTHNTRNHRTNEWTTERGEENTQRIQLFFLLVTSTLSQSESARQPAIVNSDRLRLDPIGNNIVSPRFILSVYSSLSHSRFYPFSQKQYTNNSPLLWLFAVRFFYPFYVIWFFFFSEPTDKQKKYVTCI